MEFSFKHLTLSKGCIQVYKSIFLIFLYISFQFAIKKYVYQWTNKEERIRTKLKVHRIGISLEQKVNFFY